MIGLEHGNFLQQSLSSGNILHKSPSSHRVHFSQQSTNNKLDGSFSSGHPGKPGFRSQNGKNKTGLDNRQVRFQSKTSFKGSSVN